MTYPTLALLEEQAFRLIEERDYDAEFEAYRREQLLLDQRRDLIAYIAQTMAGRRPTCQCGEEEHQPCLHCRVEVLTRPEAQALAPTRPVRAELCEVPF